MRTTIFLNRYKQHTLFLLLVLLGLINFITIAESQSNSNDYVFPNGNGSIELNYAINFDDISIAPIYNATWDILEYVVNWKNPLSNDGCFIKVTPLSSCAVEFNSSFYIYENTTEFYFPLIRGYKFRLNRVCIYNIEVERDGQKLNIINYILDDDNASNPNSYIPARSIFLGSTYNKTIERVQYMIKWKDTPPSDGYEINIRLNETSEYCKASTYNSGHFDKSIHELYIPPSPNHSFEVYGDCIYDIEINADNRKINFVDRISGDVEVRSLTINTIYNENIDTIQYVTKWSDTAPENGYSVTAIAEAGLCEGQVFNSFHVNKSVTELYMPPNVNYDFKINGNCTYKIIVKGLGKTYVVTSHIPICVGEKCNCLIVHPKPSNNHPTIENIDKDLYEVSWHFPESKENNITKVGFYLINNEQCESTGESLEIKPIFLDRKSHGTFSTKNISNGKYCLVITFKNTFSCRYSYSYVFEVFPIHDEGVSSWIHWIIIFIFTTMFMLVIIYYLQTIQNCMYKWRLELAVPSRQTNGITFSNIRSTQREDLRLLADIRDLDIQKYNFKDKYEFPRKELLLLTQIGKGAFGEVLLAKINATRRFVAVKKLRENATFEEKEDFAAEIEILKTIGFHRNIVTLLGCCTTEEPLMMIMEFVPCGDLKQYLLDLRNKWQHRNIVSTSDNNSVFTSRSSAYIVPGANDSPVTPEPNISTSTQYVNISIDTPRSDIGEINYRLEKVLDHKELQNFALQIARGMEHLEKIPIAHRDLAARNILINEKRELKISDFGLSRKGPYVNSKLKKLPLRWMALESIEDHFYDNKSDVWSFGIVLWEIATLGAFPYEKVPDSMLLYYLQNGKRLQRPEICTDELYSLMLRCWSRDKNLRPSFAELAELLDVKRTRAYVDFSQLNPLYIFPPTEDSKGWFPRQNGDIAPNYLDCG